MSRIIFDIETSGDDFESLDQKVQEYFLKYAKTEEEKEESKKQIHLSPFFGQVVAIAMHNPDTGRGMVFYQEKNAAQSEGEVGGSSADENVEYKTGSEKELLEWFWDTVKKFQQVVTFNGRGFDCPYILFRSAFHQVKPTRNLMPNRYTYNSHLDLLDQFTFYGAFRRHSMDILCQGLGIKSPKSCGVDGLMVPELFRKGECKKIAQYCYGDVLATRELLRVWEEYLIF